MIRFQPEFLVAPWQKRLADELAELKLGPVAEDDGVLTGVYCPEEPEIQFGMWPAARVLGGGVRGLLECAGAA